MCSGGCAQAVIASAFTTRLQAVKLPCKHAHRPCYLETNKRRSCMMPSDTADEGQVLLRHKRHWPLHIWGSAEMQQTVWELCRHVRAQGVGTPKAHLLQGPGSVSHPPHHNYPVAYECSPAFHRDRISNSCQQYGSSVSVEVHTKQVCWCSVAVRCTTANHPGNIEQGLCQACSQLQVCRRAA